jgi:hypothetical protein
MADDNIQETLGLVTAALHEQVMDRGATAREASATVLQTFDAPYEDLARALLFNQANVLLREAGREEEKA